MTILIVLLLVYLFGGMATWNIARLALNPYGHITQWKAARQAIVYGVLWPLLPGYVLCGYMWYTFIHKD